MESRWLRTATFSYSPDETGQWRGHWVGRAWGRSSKRWRDLRGLSFASRRRGRAWAFWIGREF